MSLDESNATARQLALQGQLSLAAEICGQIPLGSADNVPAICQLAKIARAGGKLPAAERLLQHALSHSAGQGAAELWFQLGLTLRAAHRLREAAEAYQQAVLVDPGMAAAWGNLAAVHCELQLWSQAERYGRRALELAPTAVQSLINLGEALHNLGDVAGQTSCLETAVRLHPKSALAHWNLALALLLQGDFGRGWDHYEWREAAGQVVVDAYPYPRWTDQPLNGKLLLVHGEQGVGDEILFATCYEHLLDRAEHCVLVCDSRLAPLFRRSFPEASVIGYERRKDHQPLSLSRAVDWQVPAGSVPRNFRRQASDFPRRRQFLYPDPRQVEQWRDRLGALGGLLRVGVSWRAGGQPGEHRKRSVNLADWQPLLAVPDVQWVNLQYGDTSLERNWAKTELGITIHDWPEGDPLTDLDGFAARLAALDLVISVGNATVHLAGALGVTAWAILPTIPNWRWGLAGDQSVWYASVRLVRQASVGSWRPVLERVALDLQELVAGLGGSASGSLTPAQEPLTAHRRQALAPAPMPAVLPEIADMHAALGQALAHFDEGRFEQAEALCRAVLCLAPRQLRGLHLMTRLYRRSGRTQLALDTVRRALAIQERPELCHELGLILAALGRSAESRAQLDRARRIDPTYSPTELPPAPQVPAAGPHFGPLGDRPAQVQTTLPSTLK